MIESEMKDDIGMFDKNRIGVVRRPRREGNVIIALIVVKSKCRAQFWKRLVLFACIEGLTMQLRRSLMGLRFALSPLHLINSSLLTTLVFRFQNGYVFY